MKIEANGIHSTAFYQLHYKEEADMEDAVLNDELSLSDYVIANYNGDRSLEGFINELNCADFETEEEVEDQAEEDYKEWLGEERLHIIDNIFMWMTYFEPRIYNEEIALRCNLIPFGLYNASTDETTKLLAYGGCGMNMSPRLEAYQYLTAQTIDDNSLLYKILTGVDTYESHWAAAVSKEALDEIKKK
jgi:hypothetical protein